MNVERADPSYTAWDNAIVAKSKGQTAVPSGDASPKNQDAPASQKAWQTEKAFTSALSNANDHEHAFDPSQRSQDDKAFGFWDFVDIINPLQHIPGVSTLYREITGDTISAPARIAGGMLYGGPLGFASAIGNAIMEETSGQDVGEMALAMIFDEDTAADSGGTAVASADANPADPTPTEAKGTEAISPQVVAMTTNQGPLQRENAGSTAVSQMQSNNAALQALLKDMGLSQATASTGSLPVTVAQATIAQSPVNAAPSGGIAQMASKSAPEEKVVATAVQAQSQTEPPQQRKSIPIDPSRYISTRSPAGTVTAAAVAQAAATNAAMTDAAVSAVPTAQTAAAEIASKGRNEDKDRASIQSSFADRMLEGLERYQSMSQQRSALPDVGAGGTPGAI